MSCPNLHGFPRPYQGIPEPHYPLHDKTVTVTGCGRLCRRDGPSSDSFPHGRMRSCLQSNPMARPITARRS